MGYNAKVILHSINESETNELMTMEVTFPRFILAEMNTHRMFSRNSASSRAIPTEKIIQRVLEDPFIPEAFLENVKGMQGGNELPEVKNSQAGWHWTGSRNAAIIAATELVKLNVHKQYVNRLLEPFMWHTCIISATEWSNFFAQRCHPDAQPEMQKIAYLMKEAYDNSTPALLKEGGWHLPYVGWGSDFEYIDEYKPDDDVWKQVSVARCARVSYLQHDKQQSIQKDVDLYNKLVHGMHWSPFEHVAQSGPANEASGNFYGWYQFRKMFTGENR